MNVGVYEILGSFDFLVRLGSDSYVMTKNADDPVNAGNCVYEPLGCSPYSVRSVDVVPIGIVKQIVYILRRDAAIKVNKAFEGLSDYLDDHGTISRCQE